MGRRIMATRVFAGRVFGPRALRGIVQSLGKVVTVGSRIRVVSAESVRRVATIGASQ